MRVINLTQHAATVEQVEVGVFDLNEELRSKLQTLLTFNDLPNKEEIKERAKQIVELVKGWDSIDTNAAMIGGAPFLMSALECALKEEGIKPLYAFSTREAIETVEADGSIRKTSVFKHKGFVEA